MSKTDSQELEPIQSAEKKVLQQPEEAGDAFNRAFLAGLAALGLSVTLLWILLLWLAIGALAALF